MTLVDDGGGASAEQAILVTLAGWETPGQPTPRALQEAAAEGRPAELVSAAFWRLVEVGTLVFGGNAKVKLNDIPRR